VANLKNYKVEVINPATDTVVLTVTPSSDRLTEPVLKSLSFTTNRIGGCGSARVALMCESSSALYNAPLTIGYHVRISLRCGAEAEDIARFYGEIETADEGYGTTPKVRTFSAVGLYKSLKTFPLLLFLDDKTPAEAVTAIVQQTGGVKDHLYIADDVTQIVEAGTPYTIAAVDFADTMADAALKMLAIVHAAAGQCIYGVDPSKRIFFRSMVFTPWIDPGFRVGVNLKTMSSERTGTDLINGALVTHQRKVGGGNLTLFLTPAVTKPWRIAKETVPELVGAAEAYKYGQHFVDANDDVQVNAAFEVLDFGEQLWADEQMDKQLVVYGTPTGDTYSLKLMVDSYTLSVDGDGSVSTRFQLGQMPNDKLYETFRDVLREVEVTKQRELWTLAELKASENDAARMLRRTVGKAGYRNLWLGKFDTRESVIESKYLSQYGLPRPPFSYDDAVLDESDSVCRGPGIAFAPVVPTGLAATSCYIVGENIGRTLGTDAESFSGDYIWNELTESNIADWGKNALVGYSPVIRTSATFDGSAECLQVYTQFVGDQTINESPIEVELYRPCKSDDSTVPASHADMCSLTGYTDIMLAGCRSQASPRYYAIRLYRTNSASSLVYVAMGWVVASTAMHGTFFQASAPWGSFSIGTDYPDPSYDDYEYLRIMSTIPYDDNDTWSVTIYREHTDEVLWSGSGVVDIGTGKAWTPEGEYVGGVRWKNYCGTSQLIHGVRRLHVPGPLYMTARVTRDGVHWANGMLNQAVSLTSQDETWDDGSKQVFFYVDIPEHSAISVYGIAFKH
jgi:hypothetical protein